MRSWSLERKLVVGVLTLFLLPTAVAGGVLILLYRRGVLDDPSTLALTVMIGFLVMVAYLGFMVHRIGHSLVRTLREIELGTELMATVNPDHRLAIHRGDELGSLAGEINRMADRVADARKGLEREVARAVTALAVERSTLSAVLGSLGEGVVVATPEGRVTLANEAAQAMLGGGLGLLGRSLFDFVDRDKVVHFLDQLRAKGMRVPERFSLHPSGGLVLEAVMTPFFDDDRGLIGFVLVLRDVTRPVRSDEERQRLLAETIRELRGPLSSVRSLSESLLGDPSFTGTPGLRLLRGIHDEAVRLSRVVQEMGAPSRLGAGRLPWHFERIAVSDLAAIALRRLQSEGQSAVGVEVDGQASALPPLRAEVSALSTALTHLLRAVCARGDVAGRAWFRPSRRGRIVQIDTGVHGRGSLADLERVLDVSLPVGAGHMTVREIVQQHAGEVWAYDDGNRVGFRMTLPAADADDAGRVPVGIGPVRGAGFVGAGLASGVAEPTAPSERPDFYDFSLFDEMERHVRLSDRERALAALTYVVFDIETTGFHPESGDRLVSIAGVRVRSGAVRRGETFDALVNPRRPIPAESVTFHGITDPMVAEAPPADVVLPAFLRFAEDAVLVGHQVWFDVGFLRMEAARAGLPSVTLDHPVLDTLLLSELVHGARQEHGLDAVARRLGVVVRGRHSALGDALATAEVFVRLLELLSKRGTVTLGQTIDACRRLQASRGGDVTPGAGP